MTSRKQPGPALVLAAVLALLVVAAVGIEALMSSRTSGPGAGGYAVIVVRDDDVLARFNLEDLERLDEATIIVDGEEQRGPTILSVLDEAGVDHFERIRITGMGIRDDGDLTLERDDVTGEFLLDFSRRGTVKIVSPGMAWEDRVRDVTEIVVE